MGKRKTPILGPTDYRFFQTCKTCGKLFYCPMMEDWVYKRTVHTDKGDKRQWFCSWGCLRKWEAERGKK